MKINTASKTILAAVAIVALTAGANAALAGEITGNGKSLKTDDGTLHGRSECAFSGYQDDPEEEGFRGHIAQSWGQIPKVVRDVLTALGLHPSMACNPTRAQGGEP